MTQAEQDKAVAAEVDAKLLGDKTYGRSVGYLHDHFPDDYGRLRAGIVARLDDRRSDEEISTFVFWSMRRTRVAHSLDFMAARSPALARYRTAQINLFEALRAQSVEMCAYAAAPSGPRLDLDLAPATQRAGDGLLYAELTAMVDGQTAKMHYAKPTSATFRALGQAMLRQGMTRDDLMAAGDPATFSALADDRKCRVAMALLKAIDALPAAQADMLTIEQYRLNSAAAANSLNHTPPGV